MYPVGSIYLSVNSTSPATLFGGEWEQIEDRFLLACGSTYKNGATGGASSASYTPKGSVAVSGTVGSHTLTINEMPSHNHAVDYAGNTPGIYATIPGGSGTATANHTGFIKNTGGGEGHNHGFTGSGTFTGTAATINTTPPYLAVYMWKRTA